MGGSHVAQRFVNEVLLVCGQAEAVRVRTRSCCHVCVCVCSLLNIVNCPPPIPSTVVVSSDVSSHTLTFGKHSSTVQWRLPVRYWVAFGCGWRPGDDLQPGSPGSRTPLPTAHPAAVNQPAMVKHRATAARGETVDVHVHCCTADRLSPTKAAHRQCVAQPQTA